MVNKRVLKMKVIQIGTGGWGKNHCRVLSEIGVLSAICDMNYERAKEFGEKHNVNYYKTTNELLKMKNLMQHSFVHLHQLIQN